MSDRHGLERLRQLINQYPGQVGMIAVVALLVGVSVGAKTGSIVAGLVSLVGTVLVCWAIWPLIKRFG
jgi:L-lactate permease